jgi:hypothetical protein
VPRNLLPIGDRQEDRFGRLGREYGRSSSTRPSERRSHAGMGHAGPSAVRGRPRDRRAGSRTDRDLRRGAVFYDLHRSRARLLDVFAASIKDGRGNTLHRRLFVVETSRGGRDVPPRADVLHEITPAPPGTPARQHDVPALPDRPAVEQFLYQQTLQPWGVAAGRAVPGSRAGRPPRRHQPQRPDRPPAAPTRRVPQPAVEGQTVPGLDGIIAQAEQHLDELNNRLESRQRELELERHCAIADITHLGRAWVVPHPERTSPQHGADGPRRRDRADRRRGRHRHEEARGWVVEASESENRGFDLISRRPHPEDPKTFIEVRFIEVKGRAGVGVVALSENEYRTPSG